MKLYEEYKKVKDNRMKRLHEMLELQNIPIFILKNQVKLFNQSFIIWLFKKWFMNKNVKI